MGGGRACHARLHSPSSQVHAASHTVHTMKTKRKQKQDCPSQSWELRSPCGTALRPVGECAHLPLMNPRITSHQGLLFIRLALHSPSSHSLLWQGLSTADVTTAGTNTPDSHLLALCQLTTIFLPIPIPRWHRGRLGELYLGPCLTRYTLQAELSHNCTHLAIMPFWFPQISHPSPQVPCRSQ